MTKKRTSKRALLLSALSLLMCVSMLVGSTFAWFTDSLTSGVNKIVAGNLDVELEYKTVTDGAFTADWAKVQGKDNIFDPEALWEPGRVEVVYLRVSNLGTLQLKYQLGVNVFDETVGTNIYDNEFKLSDYLVFKVVELDAEPAAPYSDRETAAAAAGTEMGLKDYNGTSTAMAAGDKDYVALVVYMPEDVDNEANYKTGTEIPKIELGINLYATQYTAESDSFGADYDEDAWHPNFNVSNANELQAAIDAGETNITLIDDVDLTETIIIPAAATTYSLRATPAYTTINLNGYNITSNGGTAIRSEGNLILTGKGKISSVTSYAIRAQKGSLLIDSNDIEVISEFGAVSMFNDAQVTINGGSYTATGAAGKTHHCIYVGSGADLTINGGAFEHKGAGISDSGAVLTVYAGANGGAKINGGTFIGSGTYIKAFDKYDSNCYLIVEGGTFSTNPKTYVGVDYIVTANDNGTYTVALNTITGTQIKEQLKDSTTTNIVAGEDINLGDSTYTDSSSMCAMTINDGKTLNLNNNTIIRPGKGSGSGVIIPGNAAVTVKNGTISNSDGDMTAVDVAVGATATFENVNFVGNGDSMIRMRASNTGKTTIIFKNCTFDNAGIEFKGMNGACEIDVQFIGCTITGTYKMYDEEGNVRTDPYGNVHYTSRLINANSNYLYGSISFDNCTLAYDASEYRYTNSNGAIELSGPSSSYNETLTVTLKDVTVNVKNAVPVKFASSAYKQNITIVEDGTNTYTNNGVAVNCDGSAK